MSQQDWRQVLRDALDAGRMIQLTLSRPLVGNATKATVRAIALGSQTAWQWTTRRDAQEFHENLTADELSRRVEAELGQTFGDLHWFASDADYGVRWKGKAGWQTKRKPPSKVLEPAAHNRSRNYLIAEGQPVPFLREIGVMAADGRVKPTMFHKFRQINRYLEFVDDVYAEFPAAGPLRVVDFGCGKSYLTFALHYYLTAIRGREVRITGLDRKADVVQHCSAIAERYECAGLEFLPGDIQRYEVDGPVHLAVSLHACDTATDDALRSAMRWNSDVIFAVPCCQHELARMMPEHVLSGLTGYGLLREHFAAMATDALRARYLETQGYRTQVVEFIDMEHTPKNVLLRAVRRDFTPDESAQRVRQYEQLRNELGVESWALDPAGQPIAELAAPCSSEPGARATVHLTADETVARAPGS